MYRAGTFPVILSKIKSIAFADITGAKLYVDTMCRI
jgi:hypothetical protein